MMSTRKKIRYVIYGLLVILAFSCKNGKETSISKFEPQANDKNQIIELPKIDVAVMDTCVRIGKQIWMLRNLDVTKFRNGDPIFEVKSNPEWQIQCEAEKPVVGYYMNKSESGKIHGNIYNWYAVNDPRGLCPKGWRVPTKEDWQELINYLGGNEQAGAYLKHSSGWGGDGNGNNMSSFAGLPGGYRGYDGISYSGGYMARWWSASEHSTYFAYGFDINYDQKSINPSTGYKQDGFSVRCIKE